MEVGACWYEAAFIDALCNFFTKTIPARETWQDRNFTTWQRYQAQCKNHRLERGKVKTITWPSVSPDLNSIKHLWSILKRKVEQQNASSKNHLNRIICEQCTSIQRFAKYWDDLWPGAELFLSIGYIVKSNLFIEHFSLQYKLLHINLEANSYMIVSNHNYLVLKINFISVGFKN